MLRQLSTMDGHDLPLIYRWPRLYGGVMRLLYGNRGYRVRYEALAEKIPEGAKVVEVCCGDCRLYLHHLKGKVGGYLGLDISPVFVAEAHRRGVEARVYNFEKDPLPEGDVVVMQASLYHFAHQGKWAVEKLLAAARNAVVIAEPVRNLATSQKGWVRWLAKRLTRTKKDGRTGQERFSAESFAALCRAFPECEEIVDVNNRRELVAIFRRRREGQPAGARE